MKYLVISDIHGEYEYASKIDSIIEKEKPNKIILLGDLYHRFGESINEYSIKISNILNKYKDIILCTRGNCDVDIDESISDFIFKDYIELVINNKNFFFTHGHKYKIDNIPDYVDVYIFGHLHTGFIKTIDSRIVANSGSLSLPRNSTPHSYLIIDNDNIILKDIDGIIIDKKVYNK